MERHEGPVQTGHAPRLRDFISQIAALLDTPPAEPDILEIGGALLKELVYVDDWLPEPFALPSPERYQQYLLHCDSQERFSVVSFVWGPAQFTPIHDHTVWGLVGMLRGAEISQSYSLDEKGVPVSGTARRLIPGDVEAISPLVGDIHSVRNAFDDRVSISIHVYGANIGRVRRHSFDELGGARSFVSGYANAFLPNVWR
jgi:predicted metal-dependent enzyme (double-stranded beta helix superfamily)